MVSGMVATVLAWERLLFTGGAERDEVLLVVESRVWWTFRLALSEAEAE
jgi:hypothetical protein